MGLDSDRECQETPLVVKSDLVAPVIMNDKYENILKIVNRRMSGEIYTSMFYESKNLELFYRCFIFNIIRTIISINR